MAVSETGVYEMNENVGSVRPAPAGVRLPQRMLPALKRWVVRGTVAEDETSHLSRHAGGRI
jgi:hypothetical protein